MEGQCEPLYFISPWADVLLPLIFHWRQAKANMLEHPVVDSPLWFHVEDRTGQSDNFMLMTDRQTDRPTGWPIEASSRSLKTASDLEFTAAIHIGMEVVQNQGSVFTQAWLIWNSFTFNQILFFMKFTCCVAPLDLNNAVASCLFSYLQVRV